MDLEPAFQQLVLQPEPQHDVQVVGDLVRLDADQRGVRLVDGLEESLVTDVAQRLRERAAQARKEIRPESAAAADEGLPQPRLRFMNAGGGSAPPRGGE